MKGYFKLLALGIALLLFPAISLAENPVQNGGFEYDLYGWTLINDLGNQVTIENNGPTFTAIEGSKNLHVVISNAQEDGAWKTSAKYPISQIMNPGAKWILRFSVKKMSQNGLISAGLMDNRPPWDSLFWTGNIDLSRQPVGSVVDYSFEFEIPYDLWYPAAVINFAGMVQDVRIDNVQIVRKDQDVQPLTTKLSGKVINKTLTSSWSKLYVVAYPEGDASWNDANAVMARVSSTNFTWSMDVPSGNRYTLELLDTNTYVYRRITLPWLWDITANSSQISGIDFQLIGKYYKQTTGWIWTDLHNIYYY